MNRPDKNLKRPRRSKRRILAALLTAAVLTAGAGLVILKERESRPYKPEETETEGVLIKQALAEDILTVSVAPRGYEPYMLVNRSGHFCFADSGLPVDPFMSDAVFDCLTPLYAAEIISSDPSEYGPRAEDFGLLDAAVRLTVTYADGEELTVLIGDESPVNATLYMTVSGEDHLYLCYTQMENAFRFDSRLLYPVEQPFVSANRIDRISVRSADGCPLFEYLAFGMSFDKPEECFTLVYPVSYPVNGLVFRPILAALANFVLGPLHAADTPDSRGSLGFRPEYVLEIAQRAGMDAALAPDGSVIRADKDEAVYRFEIGAEDGNRMRYIAFNGYIFLTHSFQLSFVYDLDVITTLTRRPFDWAADQLTAFEHAGDRYTLTKTLRADAAESARTDNEPGSVFDTAVTLNGSSVNAGAFLARYESLRGVTVSGRLPPGFIPGDVTDYYRLLADDAQREITLAPFDALHDAVGINGVYLFYIVKGGISF